jgi:uncharacterized protein
MKQVFSATKFFNNINQSIFSNISKNHSTMKNVFSIATATLFLALTTLVSCTQEADVEPTQTFNAGLNKVNFTSEGANIVGNLYVPQGFNNDRRLPAIIISAPWTQVKEQVGAAYGQRLADEGFAVLTFDHRFWGESGGQPRFLESTTAKSVDIRNAVSFLTTLSAVDANQIGALGVCAGVGNISLAAAADNRIKSLATVSPWVQHPTTTPFFYGGAEGVANRIRISDEAQATFNRTGSMPTVDAYNPNDPAAAMFFEVNYYGSTTRGAVPQWANRFAVASWKEWMELNTIDMAKNIRVPMYILYGDNTFLQDNIKAFHNNLAGQKQLELVKGEHTEFYDLTGTGDTRQAVAKVAAYFKNTLK